MTKKILNHVPVHYPQISGMQKEDNQKLSVELSIGEIRKIIASLNQIEVGKEEVVALQDKLATAAVEVLEEKENQDSIDEAEYAQHQYLSYIERQGVGKEV